MAILIALLTLFFPRLVVFILAFFTHWFDAAHLALAWMVLGFLFMPFTLLWVAAVHAWFGGVWGAPQEIVLVIAVIVDLSGGFNAARKRN